MVGQGGALGPALCPGQCLQQNVLLLYLVASSFQLSILCKDPLHLWLWASEVPHLFTRSMACLRIPGLSPWPGRTCESWVPRLARDLKPSTEEGPFGQRKEPLWACGRVCLFGFCHPWGSIVIVLKIIEDGVEQRAIFPREHLYLTRWPDAMKEISVNYRGSPTWMSYTVAQSIFFFLLIYSGFIEV